MDFATDSLESKSASPPLAFPCPPWRKASPSDQPPSPLEDYVKARGGNRVIKKVLIANNGMAATKSILSMRQWAYMELGDERAIQFVAMATPEDMKANAEFIRLADSFVEVPGGKNATTTPTSKSLPRLPRSRASMLSGLVGVTLLRSPKLPKTLAEHGHQVYWTHCSCHERSGRQDRRQHSCADRQGSFHPVEWIVRRRERWPAPGRT